MPGKGAGGCKARCGQARPRLWSTAHRGPHRAGRGGRLARTARSALPTFWADASSEIRELQTSDRPGASSPESGSYTKLPRTHPTSRQTLMATQTPMRQQEHRGQGCNAPPQTSLNISETEKSGSGPGGTCHNIWARALAPSANRGEHKSIVERNNDLSDTMPTYAYTRWKLHACSASTSGQIWSVSGQARPNLGQVGQGWSTSPPHWSSPNQPQPNLGLRSSEPTEVGHRAKRTAILPNLGPQAGRIRPVWGHNRPNVALIRRSVSAGFGPFHKIRPACSWFAQAVFRNASSPMLRTWREICRLLLRFAWRPSAVRELGGFLSMRHRDGDSRNDLQS